MKSVLFSLFISLIIVAVSACAYLAPVVDRASTRAAQAVEAYCENLTVDQRTIFGDQVRTKAAPHSVSVTCN